MIAKYHTEICRTALMRFFSPEALRCIIAANLGQDRLAGQIGHPEFHFDDNSFDLSNHYIEAQRHIIFKTLVENKQIVPAWQAFGRLTHAAQDFYTHSNYVALWLSSIPEGKMPSPDEIKPLEPGIILTNQLHSGKIYYPWEVLTYIPGLGKFFRFLLPRDAHAWMNLDKPSQGPYFLFAFTAAQKRTVLEYEKTMTQLAGSLTPENLRRFTGL